VEIFIKRKEKDFVEQMFLAKNLSNKKEDLKESGKIIVRKGWRTIVKRLEKIHK